MASKPIAAPRCIRFGDDFELDVRAYQLRSGGIPLKLRPIAMELLILLVEHRGELVTRDRIVERIWGKDVFLDTDNSINGAVSKIRQVLRDGTDKPRFLETISGKGYRFIAPITEVIPITSPRIPGPVAIQVKDPLVLEVGTQQGRAKSSALWWRWVLAALVICFAVGIGLFITLRRRTFAPASNARPMLAVLPFENLTGDPSQEYFSDGLTEEMITQLSSLDPNHLGVIARTSVMHYKNSGASLDRIGRELKVQYVLEGSIRRDFDKVRVTAQLIQVADQTHLWARQYDRELSGLLALQGEIAQEISEQIQNAIGSSLSRQNFPPTSSSYEAYDLYLKGRYFWNKRTREGFEKAATSFQDAVNRDPNYAQAYAGLADVYAMMSDYGYVPAKQYMPKARVAALRALKINESLAEAHTSLALIAENYDWDWQTAEKEYRRAIELNPNYATAHHWYAECLAFEGHFDEALVESERARQLDPLSLIIAADNGAIFYFARQYDRAIERFRTVLEMDPNFSRAHIILASYVQSGQFKQAHADLDAWRQMQGSPAPWIAAWEAYVDGREGDSVDARNAVDRALTLNKTTRADPTQFMILCYAGLDDKDKWLTWLEKAVRDRTNVPTAFKVDPLYDPLRNEPRFQDLVRQAGLSESRAAQN